jgi:hypothetical protein
LWKDLPRWVVLVLNFLIILIYVFHENFLHAWIKLVCHWNLLVILLWKSKS